MDRLHNTEFTGRNGVYSSVMEYPTVNLARPGERNGDYYTYDAGSYDRWAISYAYTQSQDDANDIAREVSDLGHMYGTDSDAGAALDPTITRYDLGGDPLEWGAERSALIRDLLPKIPGYVLRDNSPFVEVTNAYNQLMNEYARAVAPAVKYIGRYDYPFHARTLELQTSVLDQILNASRLARIRDGETKFGTGQVATIPEIMASLTTAIWSELGVGTISADRRDLQRTYLDAMARLVVNPRNGTPADARAVARWELDQLRDRIDSAQSEAADAYTQAHLFEALARIDKTLEAGLEAESN